MSDILELFQYNPWITIPVAVLAFAGLIQLWFYLYFYTGINRESRRCRKGLANLTEEKPPVSVIICARDQADVLFTNLPAFFDQNYPEFQIIVVNDASSDDTEHILQQYEDHENFYHTFVPKGVRSISARKMAMTIGIKAARYDYVLFTDASAIPRGTNWIASMMRHFDTGGAVVFGYTSYKEKKGISKRFVAYDNLFSAIQFMGFALRGKPFKACSANMAFRKELFFKNKGFSSHLFLQSGDDDLLISEMADKYNSRIDFDPDSQLIIDKDDVSYQWKEQTISHFSTSNRYKLSVRLLLFLESFTRSLFYAVILYLLIVCLLEASYSWLLLTAVLFLIRYIVQLLVINKSAVQLSEPQFYISLPIVDFILPLIKLLIRLFNRSRRNHIYTWEVLR